MITFLVFIYLTVSAQQRLSPNDSIMNIVRVKALLENRAELKKQIAVEDAKRNKVINGVTPEVQEAMNDEQDSICLNLRSQLVALELELKELLPDKTSASIISQLNLLNQGQQSNEKPVTEGKNER
jgi:hypothetical protein